jgi:hypothetical protein
MPDDSSRTEAVRLAKIYCYDGETPDDCEELLEKLRKLGYVLQLSPNRVVWELCRIVWIQSV